MEQALIEASLTYSGVREYRYVTSGLLLLLSFSSNLSHQATPNVTLHVSSSFFLPIFTLVFLPSFLLNINHTFFFPKSCDLTPFLESRFFTASKTRRLFSSFLSVPGLDEDWGLRGKKNIKKNFLHCCKCTFLSSISWTMTVIWTLWQSLLGSRRNWQLNVIYDISDSFTSSQFDLDLLFLWDIYLI